MPTLTPSLILQKTLEAYTVIFPFMGKFGTDFSAEAPLSLNQTVTAHIRIKPTKSSYDATTGYANGATESRDLLIDMPILVDRHEHVPVKLSHLSAIVDGYANQIGEEAARRDAARWPQTTPEYTAGLTGGLPATGRIYRIGLQ